MADNPARRGFGSREEGPDPGDPGWGSPMPAEYGSLAAFLPPVSDPWGTPAVRDPSDSAPDVPGRATPARPGSRRSGRLAQRFRQAVNPPGGGGPPVVGVEPLSEPTTAAPESTAGEPTAGEPTAGEPGPEGPVGAVRPAADDRIGNPRPPDGGFAPGSEPGVGPGAERGVDRVRSRRPGRRGPSGGTAGAGSMGAYGVDPAIDRDDDAAGAWSGEGLEDRVFDRGRDEYELDPAGPPRSGFGAGAGLGPGGPLTPLGTAVVPAGLGSDAEPGPPLTTFRGGREVSGRRSRRDRRWVETRWVIRHLDIWTVIKVSVIFYLIVLAAVVVASVLLWYLADSFGALHSIERSVKTLFDLKTFTLHPKAVAMWTAAGGAALAVGGTIVNVLAALVYNLISDLVGGISTRVVAEAE